MPPTVSIVTPVLEVGPLLERTVNSVTAQVGVPWELLLVGPTQPAVLPRPAETSRGRIRWMEQGGANAIELVNSGLSRCGGDFVTWLMPGDVYYRDTLRVVAETFQEQPDADLVYGDAVLFDGNNFPRGRFRSKPFSHSRLRRGCCFCQPAVFLRRGVFQWQGPLDDSLVYWSDYDYWLRLAAAGATFERTPQLLAGCEVPEATGTVHLGPFARDILPDAMAELHAVFQRHLGRVPTRWLVHAGRVAALHDPQVPPELGPHFLATLRFARAAARECRQSAWGAPLAWLLLPLESARSEWRRLRRVPQPLRRVLPVVQVSQGVRRLSGQVQRASHGVRTLLVEEPQRLAKGVAASTTNAAVAVNGATVGLVHRLRSAAAAASSQVRGSLAALQHTALHLTIRLTAPVIVRSRKLAQTCLAYSKRRLFKLRNYDPRPLRLPAAYARTTPPLQPPRISIVTPNLNQGRFLETTIRSVVDQGYPAVEYIIQDGLSTDESVDVIRRYASRLAYWTSEKDSGQANAINRGMQHATGDILAYLNSDDLLLPGSLAYVARFFASHPDVDVVYGHRVLIDDDGLDIGRWVLPPHDDDILAYVDYVPQETMFWRRSVWERVGGRLDEAFHFAMDWDLILRFREVGAKFRRLPRFLGAFRISSDNKTTRLLETVGRRDMEILRQRVLGRIPSDAEIHQVIRPYLWRHWLYDKLYLAGVLRY
jgi:glycosyltransferase involved in cell wall biosynthesis